MKLEFSKDLPESMRQEFKETNRNRLRKIGIDHNVDSIPTIVVTKDKSTYYILIKIDELDTREFSADEDYFPLYAEGGNFKYPPDAERRLLEIIFDEKIDDEVQ